MSITQNYKNLPEPLKEQLKIIESYLIENPRIKDIYYKSLSKLKSQNDEKQIKQILLHLICLKELSPLKIFESYPINLLFCYSNNGNIIKLMDILKRYKRSIIISGKLNNIPVVVKWYQSFKRDIQYEMDIYQKLSKLGCKLPWFSNEYKFWNNPILVLERLKPLDMYDDEYKIGRSVIKQLLYLHTFGVHCDIKPQNIMKTLTQTKYLLIDYGGVAMEQLGCGYRRWLWSRKWTSQQSHEKNQIVTPINDFIELGYTMKAIQDWRKDKSKKINTYKCKSGFTGRLAIYFRKIHTLDHHKLTNSDYYDLINILSKENH